MWEHTRAKDGAAVVALGQGTLALMIAGVAAALLADLRGWQVILIALLVPWSASTLVGLTVLALAILPLSARAVESSDDDARAPAGGAVPARATAPRPWSPQRQEAQLDLERVRCELERAAGVDPQAPSLTGLVLELHEARLRLARVVLVEDGELPPEMKDELVVAHRGVAVLLRSSATAADRPDA